MVFHLGEEGSCSEQRNGVSRDKAANLATAAKSLYPIIPSQANLPIPNERCIQLASSRSYGFTHHAGEAEDEEMWAILFGEHCAGFELHPAVQKMVDEIIADLKSI